MLIIKMMRYVNGIFILGFWLFCYSCVKAPSPLQPVPSAAQIEWHKMETYGFVHFGLNTFNDMEWGWGDTPPSTFNPTDLDCEQWVLTMKNAGMKAVILTAKHHDGFCLWQTQTTDYHIGNSPYKNGKGDIVRELSDACRKHGLKFGLYLSPWDRNNSHYGYPEYVEIYHKQIEELTSLYGEIFEFWFDGANGGDGYYGGACELRSINPKEYYDYEKARDIIYENNPNCMIFGGTVPTIRWVGNEHGEAGATNWCTSFVDNNDYISLYNGCSDGDVWLPAEVDVSVRPGWFYHKKEDHLLKSLASLSVIYYNSVGRNANLLLNFPVALNGKISPADSLRVVTWHDIIKNELRHNVLKNATVTADNVRGKNFSPDNVIDDDWDSYWSVKDGYDGGLIVFSFDKPVRMNRLMLQEYIPLGQRVEEFYLEGQLDGKWFKIMPSDSMTTIGYKRILRFKTVELDKLMIFFEKSKGPLCINNIEAFCAPVLLSPPVIKRDYYGFVHLNIPDDEAVVYYTVDGSLPDNSSTRYDKPFMFNDKGVIKAVTYDSVNDKYSDVAVRHLDLPASSFVVSSPSDSYDKIFDGDGLSSLNLKMNESFIELTFNDKQKISGFRYLPSQNRNVTRIITDYLFYVDGKLVSSGSFGNIENNPIEQVVEFEPVTGKTVRFVPVRNTDNAGYCNLAEFSVIVE